MMHLPRSSLTGSESTRACAGRMHALRNFAHSRLSSLLCMYVYRYVHAWYTYIDILFAWSRRESSAKDFKGSPDNAKTQLRSFTRLMLKPFRLCVMRLRKGNVDDDAFRELPCNFVIFLKVSRYGEFRVFEFGWMLGESQVVIGSSTCRGSALWNGMWFGPFLGIYVLSFWVLKYLIIYN